jgi:hypothetical protein
MTEVITTLTAAVEALEIAKTEAWDKLQAEKTIGADGTTYWDKNSMNLRAAYVTLKDQHKVAVALLDSVVA